MPHSEVLFTPIFHLYTEGSGILAAKSISLRGDCSLYALMCLCDVKPDAEC